VGDIERFNSEQPLNESVQDRIEKTEDKPAKGRLNLDQDTSQSECELGVSR
jgi:hypothetical protein